MEEEKTKKKKLTISISSKKTHSATHYVQNRQKTSVVIEKKPARRWGEKKFQPRSSNFTKTKLTDNFRPKKISTNRNFDIRKLAEERATKRFKNLKDDTSQIKKSTLGKDKKDKGFVSKREYKLTLRVSQKDM